MCHYQQSKKRQSPRKSVESASSKKSPESRSQIDDTGKSTADVLVEPPNDAHWWPLSERSSTGNLGSLENGASNSLGELDLLPESQNVAQIMPENVIWSLPQEVENIPSLHSAQPPTDMSSVPYSNGSLWPLFSPDTDWHIDLDDPSTTLPNSAVTDATPMALNELDLSGVDANPIAVRDLDLAQSYKQPTQDSESPGLSSGLIEFLRLSEKVSANATTFTCTSSFIDIFANQVSPTRSFPGRRLSSNYLKTEIDQLCLKILYQASTILSGRYFRSRNVS